MVELGLPLYPRHSPTQRSALLVYRCKNLLPVSWASMEISYPHSGYEATNQTFFKITPMILRRLEIGSADQYYQDPSFSLAEATEKGSHVVLRFPVLVNRLTL